MIRFIFSLILYSIALSGLFSGESTLPTPGERPDIATVQGIVRAPIDSPVIVSAGWDTHTQTLELEFANGSVWQYFRVSPSAIRELKNAKSPATYYEYSIRRKYDYKLIGKIVNENDPSNDLLKDSNIAVLFSPHGGISESICKICANAKITIYVQAYEFTSIPISTALVSAHERGVDVEVITDKHLGEGKSTIFDFMSDHGITVYVDPASKSHSKTIIVDGVIVITGSYNFSQDAETQNVENMLFIRDSGLAGKYIEQWKSRRELSSPYLVHAPTNVGK